MSKRKTKPAKACKRKPSPAAATKPTRKKPSPTPAKAPMPAKPAKTPAPRPTPRAAAPPKKPPSKPPAAQASPPAGDAYARRKEAARSRNAEIAETGRDIGTIRDVADPARRAACELDLERFLRTYKPLTFYLPFSADHRRVIHKAEDATLRGDLFALAMPRGSGKTAICEGAIEWALAYGHRRFAVLLGANGPLALKSLESIRADFESGEELAQDFPEICQPIAALEGISNRCKGQLCEGKQTRIVWTNRRLVLPTIDGSASSGAALHSCGILAGVRGLTHKTAAGETVRPDIFVGDDLQTDASARSPTQVEKRLRTLTNTVLGLAGPDQSIAGLVPCTVVQDGDLADQLLDRSEHPEFSGERCKLLYAMPTDMEKWKRYAEIREEGLAADSASLAHTEFYAADREAMDAGAEPAWPERFIVDKGQISAVQYALDLYFDDEARFAAEYQNQPLKPQANEDELTVAQVLDRANGMARGLIPVWATRLTAFVDVHDHLHYWMVVAWEDNFTGQIIDYGTCPQQRRPYFTLREANPRLESLTASTGRDAAGREAHVRAGLDQASALLLGNEWHSEGGATMRIARSLVDANDGDNTETVYEFCRRSPYASQILASHGKGVGPGSPPFGAGKAKAGERVGLNWEIPLPTKRVVRHVNFETNGWKSFVTARLRVPAGGKGRLEIFGAAAEHKLLADHLTAERPDQQTSEKTRRTVGVWKVRSVGRDNHWLDCLVGCAVAASIEGCKLAELQSVEPKRKLRTIAQMQAEARARRNAA